ncbi:MAG TPA: HEAT repeat domain-containing protein [Planctomycetota bacterium]|nr:HEAT repeat domain-containing protein [Planctomycetota bacterium]
MTVSLIAVCAGTCSTARAEESDKTARIEKLFREGVDLYQQGRYAEAQRKLKEVLALDPRKELAARLVDEAGTKVMAKMMADVRMGNEPTYIWQYYRQYQVKKMADKERMAKMAARLVEDTTTEDERALLYREFGELSHYSVPVLANYLKDATHENYRTYARIAIARMGARAVLPVIELLSHKEVLMRENAVLVLADIQPLDPRAIPALKARVEDPAETPAVKNYASRTLARISGMDAAQLKSAADYYYDLANRYYLDRAGVAEEGEDVDGTIWHLNEAGDLIAVQYPLWAWNEQMAEENVLKGMAVSAEHAGFAPLWASVIAAQSAEIKELLDIVNEQPAQHSFSAEEKKEVEAWDKKLVDARRLVAAVGKENVNAALNKVHADVRKYPGHPKLPGVGAFLAKELAALDPRGDLLTSPPEIVLNAVPGKEAVSVRSAGTPVTVKTEAGVIHVTLKEASVDVVAIPLSNPDPKAKGKKDAPAPVTEAPAPAPEMTPPPAVSTSGLVNGLDSSEEGIQYACALALASIDRFPNRWIGSEKVAGILGRGVSENKAVQILLVEENHNTANALRSKLEALGYGVTAAISGRDAVVQARSFPPKDIAIVSESLRRDLNADQTLEELRADVRTRYLPIGILHNQADRTSIQSRFSSDLPLVEREADSNTTKTMVEAVIAKRATESVPKRKAHETAVACATALASVDPRDTHLVLEDAVSHCIDALVNRKDDVRNPAAIFLGRVEGGSKKDAAADKLKAVALDANNAVELRRNAVRALGRVKIDGMEDVYVKLQADADQEIKDIAAESFGQVSRANKNVIDLIRAQRIDKDRKEK